MSKHPLVKKVMELFDGVLVDEYGWEHYKVDGKDYDVRFDRSRLEWACDCPAFKYRYKFKNKYCKHIIKVQDDKWSQRVNRMGRAGARVV
tara:strand:- start:21 stop:290 length:270 start_codon:yes stop_codon:yes gene_type:complete